MCIFEKWFQIIFRALFISNSSCKIVHFSQKFDYWWEQRKATQKQLKTCQLCHKRFYYSIMSSTTKGTVKHFEICEHSIKKVFNDAKAKLPIPKDGHEFLTRLKWVSTNHYHLHCINRVCVCCVCVIPRVYRLHSIESPPVLISPWIDCGATCSQE